LFHALSWTELSDRLSDLLHAFSAESSAESADDGRLMRELEIHQLELEMQNRELRDAQGALECSRAHYAELYDRAPVGYVTLDRNGWILQANLTAGAILERQREEIVGAPFSSAACLRDAVPFFAHLRRAATKEQPVTDELESTTHDGGLFLLVTTKPAFGLPASDGLFHMTLVDVTERRRAEIDRAALEKERHARAEADAANHMKDQFIGIVSHELRTPLNAVLGWAQILTKTPPDAALLDRGLALILRNGKSLARLVDDILDVSRMASGKLRFDMKWIRLERVVRNAVEDMRGPSAERRISLRESLVSECHVYGDAGRLEQVIRNLLSNALKFSDEGSEVTLSLEHDGQTAELSVRDAGSGIDPADMAHLFERFRQGEDSMTRPSLGLGLGLAIARHIVDAHQGTIEAQSDGRGRGSVFTVRLPYRQRSTSWPPGPDVVESTRTPFRSVAGLVILCIDDDGAALELVEAALRSRGAAVRAARSVDEAMSMIGTLQPDVIVTDLAMSQRSGCNLLEAVRAVPSLVAKTPVIAVSAYARPEDDERARQAGFAGHVAKPVDIETLVAVLCSAVPHQA
jgi:PAS domain S-box-containing protein